MRPNELRFPVLEIARDGSLLVINELARLETTNRLAIKHRYFDGLLLVEGSGRTFEVIASRVVGAAGPFFGLRFMKPRRIRVALDLKPIGELTLEQLRERVLANMDQQRELWESTLTDAWKEVRRATTIPELFAALR